MNRNNRNSEQFSGNLERAISAIANFYLLLSVPLAILTLGTLVNYWLT